MICNGGDIRCDLWPSATRGWLAKAGGGGTDRRDLVLYSVLGTDLTTLLQSGRG